VTRLRTLLVTLVATAALAPAMHSAQAAPASSSAPVLAPTTRPAYAKTVPPATNVLRPYGRSLRVYDRPGGRLLIKLSNPLLKDVPLVVTEYGARAPGGWIRVSLPVRPNNTVGWVRVQNVKAAYNPWRVDIYRSKHKLVVWNGDQVFGEFPVAVGTRRTPTPKGTFYILKITPSFGDFGPVVMATSGFSEVFKTFGPQGGDAATAIHGTNKDWSVGTDASHGCIRMHNPDAALLGRTLPVGTLVRILK
jgi:lipoprotein-anchoring transpeptidase ErfK/SrfK